MFIGRRDDGGIYGLWTVRQWLDQEELADDHPEVVAGPTLPHNDMIDAEIAMAYASKPISPRGATEIAYAIALYRDLHNGQVDALVAVIRKIGGEAFSQFDVPRIPDLKLNKGMKDIKAIIDATAALRAQKLP